VTAQADIVLSIEHVAVHFGGLIAIFDLNFDVREGEIVGLIGPNGAGKTTAFNVITGFLRPTSGNVRYRSTSLSGLKPHEIAKLGLVRTFQRTSVFQNNSVFQNVLIGLHDRGRSTLWDTLLALPREGRSEQELVQDAHEILQLVGLEQRASELAGTLPYGEQRLLGIALALAAKPSMLLLDEPTAGLDPQQRRAFRNVLATLTSRVKILMSTHDIQDLVEEADHVTVLHTGRILQVGTTEEFLAHTPPDTAPGRAAEGAYTAILEGTSVRNI
jgi:ABC-type branched-chain amino acid transport systems, ATPase component